MDQAEKLFEVIVTDEKGLYDFYYYIHDESFNIKEIKFDSAAKVIEIPFKRCYHGLGTKIRKNYFVFKSWEVPVLRCSLKIMNVEDYTIVDTNGVVTNSFNVIKYDAEKRLVSIDTNIPTQMEIKVSSLRLEYQRHEFKGKAHFSAIFLPIPIESGPKFIKEK